ncbi:hypothetical protein HIM_11784 [Hirsutella minnesotensis 3608]|uniref:Zn(2)-C6 fungal-type domain-containing protein n=1 Tax=Hirsutella minnesotensis 3608 TaxID=1043627 RepID=A0A0F8A0T1_9HYPO|nr:hypothetical protein HIM_11784 [Hirsutella minnesotensis 3608]
MPRRIQIRKACQRCRKKRTKCDGQASCERCVDAGEKCVYDTKRRESKDDLRAEIDRLRTCQEENDRLIRAIYAIKDVEVKNTVLQHIIEGTKSRRAILEDLARPDIDDSRQPEACMAAAPAMPARASKASHEELICIHCPSTTMSHSMLYLASDAGDSDVYADTIPEAMPALATAFFPASFPFEL